MNRKHCIYVLELKKKNITHLYCIFCLLHGAACVPAPALLLDVSELFSCSCLFEIMLLSHHCHTLVGGAARRGCSALSEWRIIWICAFASHLLCHIHEPSTFHRFNRFRLCVNKGYVGSFELEISCSLSAQVVVLWANIQMSEWSTQKIVLKPFLSCSHLTLSSVIWVFVWITELLLQLNI